MLTPEHLKTLQRPFSRADHEFIRGYVYLTEDAITNRIEEVDPSWQFELQRIDHSGEQCVVCARMTILDVAREGVGMQKVNEKAGEAEKGAATDALKRCARLFGVGRYLLNAPEQGQFDKWLADQQRAQNALQAPQKPAQDETPTQPRQNAPASQIGGATGGSVEQLTNGLEANVTRIEDAPLPRTKDGVPVLGLLDMIEIRRTAWAEKLVTGKEHFANLIDLLYREGSIRDASTADAVLNAIRKHAAEKAKVS